MKTSDRGLLALIRHEGVVPGPYLDGKGVWTFGIGHTAGAGQPDPAAMPRGMPADLDAALREAFRLFRADLATCEAEVARAVTVEIAPHEFDALVSFHYNTGGIARAALTRALNAGDRKAAAAGFMNWLRPASLRERRGAERDLFADGRYTVGPIAVWAVDACGRVDFRAPLRRLSETEALALLRPPVIAPPQARPSVPVSPVAPASTPAPEASRRGGGLLALLSILFRRS
jgi:lysozyme